MTQLERLEAAAAAFNAASDPKNDLDFMVVFTTTEHADLLAEVEANTSLSAYEKFTIREFYSHKGLGFGVNASEDQ